MKNAITPLVLSPTLIRLNHKDVLACRWKHGFPLPDGTKTKPLKEIYTDRHVHCAVCLFIGATLTHGLSHIS